MPREGPGWRVRPVGAGSVELSEGFWARRRAASRDVGLPGLLERLEANGVVGNFRGAPRRGFWFSDSDLYKWMEAAAWHAELAPLLDPVVEAVVAAQAPDGYLNTAFGPDERYRDLRTSHELYCAGHLLEAAVAHHRAGGDERLLQVAGRLVDHLWATFGPNGPHEGDTDGHPEIELALMSLHQETGDDRCLRLAEGFCRAVHPEQLDELWGHAVRACYFAAGVADVYAATGDPAFGEALRRFWTSLVEAKSYVTGGVGGRWLGESVGRAHELPNEGAYAETCAAIGSVLWAKRMLDLTGDAAYADQLELALHNGFLAGVSLDGDAYFYVNPLATGGRAEQHPGPWPQELMAQLVFQGAPGRRAWFPVTCCPPNVNRLLAALPGYVYGADEEGPWVHLFASSVARGEGWRLEQRTAYPWDGRVELVVGVDAAAELTVRVRIPGWCPHAEVSVDGVPVEGAVTPGSYLPLRRRWLGGERVVVDLATDPELVVCNPRVAENRGSVALRRGPLVYCLESVDNPGVDVLAASVGPRAPLVAEHRPDLLGGVVVVRLAGRVPTEPWGALYHRFDGAGRGGRDVDLVAIPYHTWGNRGPSAMTVWMGAPPIP